jgi:Zn-dependent protease
MGSWRIGKLFGISVFVHWSFLLWPALVFLDPGMQPTADMLGGRLILMFLVLAMFGCVILHEFGHVLTARAFGIRTRDVTLYPIGGVARLERISEKPGEEILIAIGGPAVNVAISIILGMFLVAGLVFDPQLLREPTGPVLFLVALISGNILMVLFNSLPAFPMDGGRVFRALLAIPMGRLQATRVAAWLTTILALVGIVVGFTNPQMWMLPIIAVFIFFAAQQELQAVEMQARRKAEAEAEPILAKAIPVAEGWPVFTLKPAVTVYVWDNEAGVWIKQRSGSS